MPASKPTEVADTGSLSLAKDLRRKVAVASRDAISPDYRATASAAITRELAGILTERRAASATALRVATYCPIRSEVDVRMLSSLAPVDTIFLHPRVVPGTPFLEFAEGALTGRGPFGIPEPASVAVSLTRIDVVIVPGLAFDFAGERLGYGKGFYDRVLSQLRKDALSIGVAFEGQLGPVPTGPLDRTVDQVVTEQGTRFRRV